MADSLLMTNSELAMLLIAAVLAIAVVTDVRKRKIYNALTFPTIVMGLVVNGVVSGPKGLLLSITGLLLGAVLFALPVAFLGRGAGDLKLIAAIGAIGGPVFVLWSALLAGVAGAILAASVLVARRRLGVVLAGMALDVTGGHVPAANSNIRLPYAVPIAAGVIAALAFF
jgi:prepilin peptidase CpaA